MFKLPELTYPLSVNTIGKMMAMGEELDIHCYTQECRHRDRVNLVMVARKLGMDHGCLDGDLRRYFYCQRCREAGRPDRNFGFTHIAATNKTSPWPRRPSAYEKAKGL